jgi:hypothetical protein
MKTSAVIEFFGGARQAAEALGVSTQAIYAWGEDVPKSRQAHVELASKGKLKRDKPVYGAK